MEIKPRTEIEFWTDKKYYKNVVKLTTEIGVSWGSRSKEGEGRSGQYIRVRKVLSGKFHRYSGWGFSDYFKYWETTIKDLLIGNILGFIGFVGGIIQSFFRMAMSRPDVIFLKGGFVGLPVGLAARVLHIPYVVHESDAVPGLANRLLMKKAAVVAVTMKFASENDFSEARSARLSSQGADANARRSSAPSKKSSPSANFIVTGVPVAVEFKPVSASKQKELKKACGFDTEKPLVMVTGGSQGAQHINEAMREILPEILKFSSVGLVAGRKHYEDMVDLKKYEEWDKAHLLSNFRLWEFSPVMNELLGAADVVVSRAGATTIAELAALKKAVVLVPYEKLPGGHQTKNAELLSERNAVEVVRDDKMVEKPELLLEAVRKLVRSPKKRADMAEALHGISRPAAADDLAKIVLGVGGGGKK